MAPWRAVPTALQCRSDEPACVTRVGDNRMFVISDSFIGEAWVACWGPIVLQSGDGRGLSEMVMVMVMAAMQHES